MVRKNTGTTIGYVAFLLGFFIAIIAGLFIAASDVYPEIRSVMSNELQAYISVALLILGLVVGLLNLLDKDASSFLIAVLVLAILPAGSSLLTIKIIGPVLIKILSEIAIFVIPTAVVVSLKVIWDMAKI